MVDRLFSDLALAELYDAFCLREQREDFRFYLPLVMSADAVLDVGAGTGALLHQAREAGHTGHLCGLDPAVGMLEQARKRSDIEWVLGDLGSVDWHREFDLVVMTGHAFQVYLEDDELREALAAIHRALAEGGRFAFETRNPAAREWERWTPDHFEEATAPSGAPVRLTRRADPPDGDRVHFTHTFTSPAWDAPQRSHSTLRFLDAETLHSFLSAAGLTIEHQFGHWNRTPVTHSSPEIITIARKA